jgi:GTP-binding protein EngB required for normal cell division
MAVSLLKSFFNKEIIDKKYTFEDDFMKGISICVNNPQHFFNVFKSIYTNIFKNTELNKEFESPKICVIGSQSSGKSSLLENITKTPLFPKRKQGVGTKTPIKLNLNCTNKETDESEFWVNGEKVEKMDIISKIDLIFEKLGDSYGEKPIEVQVSNNNLIDFEFYDLPGIVSYPQDKKDFTEKLTEQYISQDNNIILCVIPITITDLSTYFPISLIKKYKREKNTIIVFTMADKVQKEDIGDQIISRILNESSEINIDDYLGVNIIINRNENNCVSLEKLDSISSKWFKDNIIDLIPDNHPEKGRVINKLGINNLIDSLNVYYKDFIDKNWIPKTMDNINSQIIELCHEEYLIGFNFTILETEYNLKLIEILKQNIVDMFVPVLLNMYYDIFINIINDIKYETFYNFELYFEILNERLESVSYINFRKYETIMNHAFKSYLFGEGLTFTNAWRFGELNNLISKKLLKNFKYKFLTYLKLNKLNVFNELIDKKINQKNVNYNNKIVLTILEFSKMEFINEKGDEIENAVYTNFNKGLTLTNPSKLTVMINKCLYETKYIFNENIFVYNYRFSLCKKINDLQISFNKLNILKYENDTTKFIDIKIYSSEKIKISSYIVDILLTKDLEKSKQLLEKIKKYFNLNKITDAINENDDNPCFELFVNSKKIFSENSIISQLIDNEEEEEEEEEDEELEIKVKEYIDKKTGKVHHLDID